MVGNVLAWRYKRILRKPSKYLSILLYVELQLIYPDCSYSFFSFAPSRQVNKLSDKHYRF